MPFRCLPLSLPALSCLCAPVRARAPEWSADGVDADGLQAQYATMANPGGAARISDSDASCEPL